MVYIVALISISLGAIAQFLLKVGMNNMMTEKANGLLDVVKESLMNIPLLGGLGCYGLSMIFWLYVLSNMELSKAYPLVSLGYVVTLFIGYFLLGEALNLYKILGVLMIVIGVFFITKG